MPPDLASVRELVPSAPHRHKACVGTGLAELGVVIGKGGHSVPSAWPLKQPGSSQDSLLWAPSPQGREDGIFKDSACTLLASVCADVPCSWVIRPIASSSFSSASI